MTVSTLKPRKQTVFRICDRHKGWFAGETRRRIAETFVEGGPGHGGPCAGGRCRMWPGTDFYVADICHGEHELDWGGEDA